jgi:Na+/H+ antiporter NhaA
MSTARLAERTAWARGDTPFRRYLRTESGSAAVLLAATVAALLWVNVDAASYARVWDTTLSVRLGSSAVSLDLRRWVNGGLMTFFFFVVGLEARRELDLGELRERARAVLPLLAGVGGMVGAVAGYLALNAGSASASGWGVAMSTDTAFALGALTLAGTRAPDRLRGFLLTVVVVDDIVALCVIAAAYTDAVVWPALAAAVAVFAVMLALVRLRVRRGLVFLVLGIACWLAVLRSGIDPVVVGLAAGLATYAAPAARTDLERATDLFRGFREQPTPELAQSARAGLQAAVSPNDRLQQVFHPWTSYVIVPLFALANAGIPVDPDFLARAFRSPITLGILAGYLVGKPVGVVVTGWLGNRLSHGRLTPPVGWGAVTGGGMLAGIGFTVSLLIASLAFEGADLQAATLGILTSAAVAAALSWLLFVAMSRLPAQRRLRALVGSSDVLVDLAEPVDPARDHIRGAPDALVTLVEYGDFECPYCGQAEPPVRALLADVGDLRYVWRHLPLTDVHPRAQLAAEAAEAAALQGAFWPMHDRLLEHQDELAPKDLRRHAEQLGLDLDRFADDLREHSTAARVAADVVSADLSGVAGTPTFFLNGHRHLGAYDLETLTRAVHAAKAAAFVSAPARRT